MTAHSCLSKVPFKSKAMLHLILNRLSLAALALVFASQTLAVADQNPAPVKNKEEYRQFASDHHGNLQRGKKLFSDTRVACIKCHTVDGSSSNVGPDLAAVGNKFSRNELIQSLLEPSS